MGPGQGARSLIMVPGVPWYWYLMGLWGLCPVYAWPLPRGPVPGLVMIAGYGAPEAGGGGLADSPDDDSVASLVPSGRSVPHARVRTPILARAVRQAVAHRAGEDSGHREHCHGNQSQYHVPSLVHDQCSVPGPGVTLGVPGPGAGASLGPSGPDTSGGPGWLPDARTPVQWRPPTLPPI